MWLSAARAEQAVKAARKEWGERQLEELEAEERLSVVCERGPVSDPVISQLREAFQVCLCLESSSPPLSLTHLTAGPTGSLAIFCWGFCGLLLRLKILWSSQWFSK